MPATFLHSENIDDEEKVGRAQIIARQLFVCSSAVVASISFGMTTAFTATLLPELKRTGLADTDTQSWLAATVVLAMMIGVAVCSLMMRLLGRKVSQILSNVPWLFGWPYMWLAGGSSLEALFVGCFLVGFSAGFSSTSTTVYTAEVSEPALRGLVAIFVSIGVAGGILCSHWLGVMLPWRTALLVSVCVPMVSFTLAFFSPESPNWLLLQQRFVQAGQHFYWLRGRTQETAHEFNSMRRKREDSVEEKASWNLFSPSFLKPFLILTFMFTVQQGSGSNLIAFYAVDILQGMSNSVNAEMATLLIDVIRILSAIFSAVFIKTMRRRTLFFISATGTFLALTAMLISIKYSLSDTMLITSVCAYIWSVYLGIIPVPWIMCGELYPAVARDLGSGVTTIYAFFAIFLMIKNGPPIIELVSIEFLFILCACTVLVGSVLLYFKMPETKNVTLQQIEERIFDRRGRGG